MNRLIAILVLSVTLLIVLGSVALYSSTTSQSDTQRVSWHLCWVGLGLALGSTLALVPYPWLRRGHLPKWLLGLALMLLAAVLVPGIGVSKNGACRWLPFGQPSEFAKVALLIFLADYCATNHPRMWKRTTGFLWPGLAAGVVCLLVFLEPDWGTAGLLAALSLALLVVAGAQWGYILSAAIIGLELFVFLLLRNPVRLDRVLAFLNPESYQQNVGWQGWHSLLALGSGGWFGTFFGEGSHKNGFVPEQQTDFLLSLVGEELGFAGTSLVLGLFAIIVLCGARVAWKINDPFAQLLALGIACLIGLQAFINFGVVTSSLPNKGIALPFMSYGGSSLVSMCCCVGLLISIARRARLAPAPAWCFQPIQTVPATFWFGGNLNCFGGFPLSSRGRADYSH